jgi:hypothetical protein
VNVIDDSNIEVEVSGVFSGVAGIRLKVVTHQNPVTLFAGPQYSATRGFPQNGNGGTIGPQDGTYYEVIATRQEERQSPFCGYNDFGLPNSAIYQIETRQYRQYIQGSLVSTWQEDVDTFLYCNPA